MAQGHDQVGARRAQRGDRRARGPDRIGDAQVAGERRVPIGRAGRHEAHDPHPQPARRARAVGHLAIEDDEGRDHPVGALQRGVGQRDPESRLLQRPQRRRRSPVEVVVAKRAGVVARGVHRRDHRMRARGVDEIRRRRAVQNVAVVQKDGIRMRRPLPRDQRGDGRQSPARRGASGEIVARRQMHVQVAGGEDPQVHKRGRVGRVGRVRCCHPAIRSAPLPAPSAAVQGRPQGRGGGFAVRRGAAAAPRAHPAPRAPRLRRAGAFAIGSATDGA